MKKLIGILLVTVMIGSVSMAQEKKEYKEIEMVEQSEIIAVSADQLWQIVGPGFGEAGIWSTAIDHSVGSGEAEFEGAMCSIRSCEVNVKGFDKVGEILTMYNENKQTLTYKITEGMPGFVLYAANNWRVVGIDDTHSRLEMTATIHTKKFMGALMGGMLRKNLEKVFPALFLDLKVYAETGDVSDDKKERIAELEAKK